MNWLDKLKGKIGRPEGAGAQTPGSSNAGERAAQSRAHAGGTVVRSGAQPASGGAAADWASGQQVLDDFVVEKTLGEGGMGKVYLLRSRSNGSAFAVKRATGFNEAERRSFLAELQTWIDLPDHANLVPCRFFRTMDSEILIFAEYVEGGSLVEWIDSRRLYAGGQKLALERMLDVAIQFAWGLGCLHELGLVHQDVKPGNVLMSGDGETALQGVRPRVTDYGLTRMRAAGGESASTEPSRNARVSTVGGSPAYWSPEQAAGWPLTRSTDIWSWGVSVLEMFTGGATWESGLAADEVLEQYLLTGAREKAIPAMPRRLAALLKECFRQEPTERLTSLSEAVTRLKAIYRESTGKSYGRSLQGAERAAFAHAGISARRSVIGTAWTDPRVWMEKALRAAGRDPAEAATMLGQRGATRRGELVAELAAYDEAKRLYLRLVREGHGELESDLAKLCVDKALVHKTVADVHGASQEYDQAIAIWERLVNTEGRREMANYLAAVYVNKASSLSDLGDHRNAVALCDLAIAVWDQLVNREGRSELANDLAIAYTNKALAVNALGDNRGALALYDRAIAIRESLVRQEGRGELAYGLAVVYKNKAVAMRALGDNQGAVSLFDRAIAILEQLIDQEGRRELVHDLATACTCKANALSILGDQCGAVALYDRAIAVWEQVGNQEGRRELADYLPVVYLNKANALKAQGSIRDAVALYDQAIAIWERLVNQEGRRELANNLAIVHMNKAVAMSELGDHRCAVAHYDRAIAIRERLVNQEGRRELIGDLARAKASRGDLLLALGEQARGLEEMRSAQKMLEAEIARTGRADLKRVLAWVQRQLANHSA